MSLFDFFKKRKKPEKKIEKKIDQPQVEKAGKKEQVETRSLPQEKKPAFAKATVGKEEARAKVRKPKREIFDKAYRVLSSPHVTEKATKLAEENKYIFKVLPRANKIEIKKVIEGLYGVDVVGVKIINIPKRKRRLGRQEGWRKGYKKAIVKIKKGQKIEILPR